MSNDIYMNSDIKLKKVVDADNSLWYHYRFSAERRERLTNAMRKVIDRVSTIDVPLDTLDDIAEMLERVSDKLDTLPKRKTRTEFFENISEADICSFFAYDPILGRLNPLAPPLDIRAENNVAVGTVTFGAAYEGAHGFVHGEFIAGAFDVVLGCAEAFSGVTGVTGSIQVRYLAPTPIHTDLRMEGRFDRIEGRKIYTKGKLYAGDQITAEATGIYISLTG